MFSIDLNIGDVAIIWVDLVVADVVAWDIDHSDLSLCCDYDVVLDEMETADLLAVEVEVEEFLLVLDAHADDGPLDVTETDHAFFLVDT